MTYAVIICFLGKLACPQFRGSAVAFAAGSTFGDTNLVITVLLFFGNDFQQ